MAGCALVLGGCPGDDAATPDAAPSGRDAGDGFHDDLSMPEEPTLSVGDFRLAGECGSCHPTHYAEWKTSMHAYAMVDPVFRAMVAVRQRDFDGAQDQFCTQCHSAIGTRGGEIVDNFSFDDLSPIVLEGITCESCHRVRELRRLHNSGHVIDPSGPIFGPIADPLETPAHRTEHSPLLERSEFCAGCHDVLEVDGLFLERPYDEWLESPDSGTERTCQGCHMPAYVGTAVRGGPERTLHRHRFVGVDVPLSDGFVTDAERETIREGVRDLLGGAADLRLSAQPAVEPGEQIDLVVTVENLISGHNLPTGSTFIRQLWVEVIARDAAGTVLYETGTLDANGDLRDHFSELDAYGDADLLSFGSTLLAPNGDPEIFSWRAVEHVSRSLPPLHERTHTLFVPTTTETVGPIEIQARLRFRTHPPFLLRRLGLADLVDRLQVYDIATATRLVDCGEPLVPPPPDPTPGG